MGEGRGSLNMGVGFANQQCLQNLPLWLAKIQIYPFSYDYVLRGYSYHLSMGEDTCSSPWLHLPLSPSCVFEVQLSASGLVVACSLVTLPLREKVCAPSTSSKVLWIKEQGDCDKSSHLENGWSRNSPLETGPQTPHMVEGMNVEDFFFWWWIKFLVSQSAVPVYVPRKILPRSQSVDHHSYRRNLEIG